MKTAVPSSLHSNPIDVLGRLPGGFAPRAATWAAACLALVGPAWAGLVLTPGTGLNATGFIGGPFTPSQQVYTLSNDGTGVLPWAAIKDQPWVSISASSGTLAAGQSTNVTVFVNAVALDYATGAYSATISFIDVNASLTTTRSANLSIGMPVTATVSYAAMPASNQLQLRITGQSGTSFRVQQATKATGPWTNIYTNTFSAGLGTYNVAVSGAQSYFRTVSDATPSNVLSLLKVSVPDLSEVVVTGSPYGTYGLDASTDGGSTWTPVSTNKAPASGSFTYISSNTNQQYRTRALGTLTKPVLDHVLIVGESLARGFDGDPALSTTASPKNFRSYADASGTTFLPLFEASVETIASGAAEHVSASAADRRLLLSNIGLPNTGYYSDQRKGHPLYAEGVYQFEAAPQAAALALFSCRPRAIFALAGNTDIGDLNYDVALREWQSDYQADIQRVTGYTEPIPMFHCQVSAWTSPTMGAQSTANSPCRLLAEFEANPTKTVLVCPSYMIPYANVGADFPGMHPSNAGYRRLGEYFAKAYKRVVVEGGSWTPLRPSSVTRSGVIITATFAMESPPLVLDTSLVTNPGSYGFEYWDDSGSPPTITDVRLTGAATVQVTLSGMPIGGNKRLRYAYTGVPGQSGGPTTGPRGNLRDSDSEPSQYGNLLHNWCVHFDKPVN